MEKDTDVGLEWLLTAVETRRVVVDEKTTGISELDSFSKKVCDEWACAASIRLVTQPEEHWRGREKGRQFEWNQSRGICSKTSVRKKYQFYRMPDQWQIFKKMTWCHARDRVKLRISKRRNKWTKEVLTLFPLLSVDVSMGREVRWHFILAALKA